VDVCLTPEELRVLECLLEKKMATPEYYPLSLNALLEQEVATLTQDLAALRQAFAQFKQQFE